MKTRWRLLAVLLLGANLGYFAWSQGVFAALGFQPARLSEREPHRLDQQVRPELLQINKAP
ncbi:sporulation protein [Variovorax sp. ZT4R33]|uniref:sporulation protein n=1 Tax=Variovorax sp. ZT4R33 TaxID=3443743 RepID=UPI003F4765AA